MDPVEISAPSFTTSVPKTASFRVSMSASDRFSDTTALEAIAFYFTSPALWTMVIKSSSVKTEEYVRKGFDTDATSSASVTAI